MSLSWNVAQLPEEETLVLSISGLVSAVGSVVGSVVGLASGSVVGEFSGSLAGSVSGSGSGWASGSGSVSGSAVGSDVGSGGGGELAVMFKERSKEVSDEVVECCFTITANMLSPSIKREGLIALIWVSLSEESVVLQLL